MGEKGCRRLAGRPVPACRTWPQPSASPPPGHQGGEKHRKGFRIWGFKLRQVASSNKVSPCCPHTHHAQPRGHEGSWWPRGCEEGSGERSLGPSPVLCRDTAHGQLCPTAKGPRPCSDCPGWVVQGVVEGVGTARARVLAGEAPKMKALSGIFHHECGWGGGRNMHGQPAVTLCP